MFVIAYVAHGLASAKLSPPPGSGPAMLLWDSGFVSFRLMVSSIC